MKLTFACVSFLMVSAALVSAQDKPRVYVQGKGSQDVTSTGSGGGGRHWGAWGSSSTVDSHDESMEVTKNLQKDCSGVMVTLNQSNADYTVMLNRESKKNRGLLRSNSQVQVANRIGDVLGTSATHTVGNAAKDACELIVADWQTHGRMNDASAAVPATTAAVAQPVAPAVTPGGALTAATTAQSTSATKLQQQHQACLALAKDNPSIVCK